MTLRIAGDGMASRRVGVFLALALQAFVLEGQAPVRFERLTPADGLIDGHVIAVFRDSRGFLWLGTSGGLNRYDGYTFRSYVARGGDPRGLTDNLVLAIAEDAEGDLWVGTGKGLNRLRRNEGRFVHYRHDPDDPTSLDADLVNTLVKDSESRLWIGTVSGLNRFDPATGAFVRHPEVGGLRADGVESFFEDRQGNLWVATSEGLTCLRHGDGSVVRYRHRPGDPTTLSGDAVVAVAAATNGRLWVATSSGGVDLFDPAAGTVVRDSGTAFDGRLRDGVGIYDMQTDSWGDLWITTRTHGVFRWRPDRGELVHYPHDPKDSWSLSSNRCSEIVEDRGILWIGTDDGLAKYDLSREQFWSHPEIETALSLAEDRDGGLWVGTDRGVVHLDAEHRIVTRDLPDPDDPASLPAYRAKAVHQDPGGELWVGTAGGGLARRRPGSAKYSVYRQDPEDPASLPADHVDDLLTDRRGRLWVATARGLRTFRPDRGSFEFDLAGTAAELLRTEWVSSTLEDRAGVLWFATRHHGLFRYDPESSAVDVYRRGAGPKHLSSDELLALLLGRDGTLWVATRDAGVNRLAPGAERFVHLEILGGLSDGVQSLAEDSQGNVWLATRREICRLDPETGTSTALGLTDGLWIDRFIARCSLVTRQGEVFFCGLGGLISFDPEKIRLSADPPPVVLTDFLLDHKPVEPAGTDPSSPLLRPIGETRSLRLDYHHGSISFEFAALDYTRPRWNRYAHRLEGFDDDWILTDATNRWAHYTNLDPGRYVLRVKASNSDGVWNEEGVTLEVFVAPPPWRTWWAYTVYVAAALALAGSYLRSQRRKLERERHSSVRLQRLLDEVAKRNRELQRINDTIAHDLMNPLLTIRTYIGALKKDVASRDERVKRDFLHLDQAAAWMHRLVHDLFELSRLSVHERAAEVVDLAKLAGEVLRDLAEKRTLGRVRTTTQELPAVVGDPVLLRELLFHLLDNAVKFLDDAADPHVEIGFSSHGDGGYVYFVRDNGIGIETRYRDKIFQPFERLDPKREGTGLGLAVVKRIAEMHGGEVWVESEGPGRGSTFCFTIPGPPEEIAGPT